MPLSVQYNCTTKLVTVLDDISIASNDGNNFGSYINKETYGCMNLSLSLMVYSLLFVRHIHSGVPATITEGLCFGRLHHMHCEWCSWCGEDISGIFFMQ